MHSIISPSDCMMKLVRHWFMILFWSFQNNFAPSTKKHFADNSSFVVSNQEKKKFVKIKTAREP